MVHNVAAGTVSGQEHASFGVLPTPRPRQRGHPFEGSPTIIIGTWVPILWRSAVVDGDHHSIAEADESAAEGVVDGTVVGRVCEAASMEEDDDRDDGRGSVLSRDVKQARVFVVCAGGRPVYAAQEVCGGVDGDVKRADAFNRGDVGRDLPIEEFREVAIEGAIWPAEEIVCQLKIGDEHPCVERNHHPGFIDINLVTPSH